MTISIQMNLQTHFLSGQNFISPKKSHTQFTPMHHLSDIRNKATNQRIPPIGEIISCRTRHPEKNDPMHST